jgi:excisionase family DNA binding protein
MSTATTTPQLLTIPEVMAALRLGRSAVYDLIRSGQLPSLLVRTRRRVPDWALRSYIDQRMQEVA